MSTTSWRRDIELSCRLIFLSSCPLIHWLMQSFSDLGLLPSSAVIQLPSLPLHLFFSFDVCQLRHRWLLLSSSESCCFLRIPPLHVSHCILSQSNSSYLIFSICLLAISWCPSHNPPTSLTCDMPLSSHSSWQSLQSWLCRIVVASKLYASMASVNWMFVEGLLLHTKLSGVFTEGPPFPYFYLIGWGELVFALFFSLLTKSQSSWLFA